MRNRRLGMNGLLLALGLLSSVGCMALSKSPLAPSAAPVPATQEIELLDPGQSPTGIAPVVAVPKEDGTTSVDVPPTIMVHRYYPSGDRSFQGPMLPGGPMIAAVSHPRTLERVYVPLNLPPGAPRVVYSGRSIVYDYGAQQVTLHFGLLGRPTVSHTHGTKAGYSLRESASNAAEESRQLADLAGFPKGLQFVKEGFENILERMAMLIGSARRDRVVIDPELERQQR